MPGKRAIGIVRVSQVKGREGESFASPSEQHERIEAACERDGLRLLRVENELRRQRRHAAREQDRTS